MQIYHLSHTDLDGYGAQTITNHYFKDIKFYNSNYGKEIDEKFNEILSNLGDEKSLILITDLNLTLAQCEEFEKSLESKNAKLILLDHHQSGAECASKFDWYFLDSSRCATKITHDFFSAIYGVDERLKKFSDVVNAVDIWLKDDENFEMGKVCLGLIANAKEINKVMFEEQSTQYMFYLIQRAREFFNHKNDYIGLDEAVFKFKKDFFRNQKDNTLSNLISDYVVDLLTKNRDRFEIKYNEFKGILTYNIGNTSVIGNDFLVANDDIDFFIDVTSKKTLSFRANGRVDVSQMAKNLVGGGGHVNASGGMFAGFKDSFSYDNIKAQIVDLITKKTLEKEQKEIR
ncbi:DHH family phosphoesterase [Campylobacter sp. RM16192]|uniref:DHH family phosphoesterase n=1 Tax=Campylobacter sp. RM16192 TaxID=1660080 RepID=UPI0014516B79|nr:DHH family phosphoesterase [Campylobacter sp. RM16192]QCD52863.1 DHH-type phosphohydrolase [Campylobacter sp. RM16192]